MIVALLAALFTAGAASPVARDGRAPQTPPTGASDAALPAAATTEADAPAQHEAPENPDRTFLHAPFDAATRLAFARRLAAAPGHEEEAAEVLGALLAEPVLVRSARRDRRPVAAPPDPETWAAARDGLEALVRSVPARPGWADLYARLAATGPGPAREAARARQLELLARLPDRRARALAELARSRDPLAARILGDLRLEADDVRGARAAWTDGGQADRLALLAALSANDADHVTLSATLVAAGLPATAERVLVETAGPPPSADPQVLDRKADVPGAAARRAAALLALSALRLGRGDGEGALAAADHAHAIAPSAASAAARVRARLALGRADEAAAALDAGPVADREALERTLVLLRARGTTSLEDDRPAAEAGFRRAPDEVDTAAFLGRLAAADRPSDALAPLARATALHPDDAALHGRLVDAAVRAGEPARAVAAARALVALAPDPAARKASLDGLSGLLLAAADVAASSSPTAGPSPARAATSGPRADASAARADDALAPAPPPELVALAIRPGSAAVARAVGGRAWASGALEAAYALYARAAEDPTDLEAGRAAAALALALGRRAEFEARLARLPADHPGAVALRDESTRADAFAAARALADLTVAEATWRAHAVRWPEDPRFLHGLGDTLLAAGKPEEALAAQRAAVDLAPDDPWNRLGVAQAELALGRLDGTAAALDALVDPPPDAAAARDRLRAAILRARGEAARRAADPVAAVARFRAAQALEHDLWTAVALAGALLDAGEAGEALAAFRAVRADVRQSPDAAAVDRVATLGEVGALEAIGQNAAALASLESLAARDADPTVTAALDGLLARLAARQAEVLRRAGDLEGAEQVLRNLAIEASTEPLVQATTAALLLDLGRPCEAVDVAARVLVREPTNRWALDVARRAGRAGGCSGRVEGLFRAAIAGDADPSLAADLRLVEVALRIERALAARAAGRRIDAREALADARRLARDDARALLLLAEAERAFGRPRPASRALERAYALAPKEAEVVLALVDALEARGRPALALAVLETRWAASPDERVGARLAALRAAQPPPTLGPTMRAPAPGSAAPAGPGIDPEFEAAEAAAADDALRRAREEARADRAPDEAGAPEGGAPGPDAPAADVAPSDEDPEDLTSFEAPSFGPRDLAPRGGPDRPATDRRIHAGVLATAGFGALRRSGTPGFGEELATYLPLHLGPPRVGPVQLDVEATLVRVEDGVSKAWGVAPAVGAATRFDRAYAGWLRVGTSPIGFGEDPPYPVWFLGGRGKPLPALAVGLETGRAPVLDSYTSWVGGADTFTGTPMGRVHHTWGGAWLSVGAPWGTDVGLLGRLGQSDGMGLEPTGRAEAVAWLGQRIGSPSRNVRLGGEGVAFSHERQVDGFQTGQGAFYSPPIFAVATGRLDVRWTAFQERLAVCGGVGAGVQYAGGGYSPWFAPGESFTHNERFRVAWRAPSGWGVALEGGWLTAGTWHQETGLLRFGRHLDGSPPLTTFATPSMALWYQGEPC